jgi:hypothetical protein
MAIKIDQLAIHTFICGRAEDNLGRVSALIQLWHFRKNWSQDRLSGWLLYLEERERFNRRFGSPIITPVGVRQIGSPSLRRRGRKVRYQGLSPSPQSKIIENDDQQCSSASKAVALMRCDHARPRITPRVS